MSKKIISKESTFSPAVTRSRSKNLKNNVLTQENEASINSESESNLSHIFEQIQLKATNNIVLFDEKEVN